MSFRIFVVEGKRKRSVALVDTQINDKARSVYLSASELVEYLEAKRVYERYQDRFRHVKRYGW